MTLNICVVNGVNIYEEDLQKLEEIINDKSGSRTLVCCDRVNLNNRTIVFDKKVYSPDDDSFNIVLGGYADEDTL